MWTVEILFPQSAINLIQKLMEMQIVSHIILILKAGWSDEAALFPKHS